MHRLKIDKSLRAFIRAQKTVIENQKRCFFHTSKQNQMKSGDKDEPERPMPRLLYIQNPLVWLSNKIDFRSLRVSYDPDFTEKEFTRGARQAIATVTQLLSARQFDSMKPMFTKGALLNLKRDMDVLWTDDVKKHIALQPNDVQLIIPRKLHLRQINGEKLCDVDVLFIGLKHLDSRRLGQAEGNDPLLFVEIISRFHRNYSATALPEWTIAAFKLRKVNVVPTKTA